jgi:HEAT repeat protein
MATTGNCQDTQGLLQVLVEGGLTAGERAAVEAHVAGCPACTAEGARLKDNADFLREVLGPFRMPADLTPEFLLALPPKDQKRKTAAPSAAPRTLVLGDTRPRGASPWKWIGVLVFLGAAGALGWLFLSGEKPQGPRVVPDLPEVTSRPPAGQGPADGKKPLPKPLVPKPGVKPPVTPEPPAEAPKSAADLVASLRAVRGDGFNRVIWAGWALLASHPAEAKAIRDLAAAEKDARLRAALVACIGADGTDENRSALAGHLSDPAAEVRGAAVLALGRSLSFDNPQKRPPIGSGPPVSFTVEVGAMVEDPARGTLASRLSSESEPAVKRLLVAVLAASAPSDPAIRDALLEAVKGTWGDDLREPALKALFGMKDPAVVEAYADVLVRQGTPKSLHGPLIEGMAAADEAAAAAKLAELLPKAEGADLRREILHALSRLGGPAAQKAFTDALAGDQDATVRLAAVTALRKFPVREVLDAVQHAAENDGDHAVRQEADQVAKILKATLEKAEGQGGDNPPAPPPPVDGN